MGATVRQLDWRFLLSGADRPFDHLVWLGGTPELAEWTMKLGIARSVSFSEPITSAADALVISRGAKHLTNRVSCRLRPGGSLYYELGRDPRDGSSWTQRRQVQVYWTAPGGSKVAWFKDPDGNILSLTELSLN